MDFDFDPDELNNDCLDNFSSMTHVEQQSRQYPEMVLQILLKCHEYDCARKWACIHKESQFMFQVVYQIITAHIRSMMRR